MTSPIIVYKIGGSLLLLPDLVNRLSKLLSRSPHCRPLLVVGGGAMTDVVRKWDAVHRLGDKIAHQLAMQSLALNEALLLDLMSQTRYVTGLEEAEEIWHAGGIPLLATSQFMAQSEPESIINLPESWDVTSDSIAAFVAFEFSAHQLVLVKSIDEPIDFWENNEAVDPYFSTLLPLLHDVAWVNLRDGRLLDSPKQ